MYCDLVYGISGDTQEKTNREPQIRDLLSASGLQPSLESRPTGEIIGFAYPHSRNPASLSCSSLHRERVGDEVDDLSGANR